MSMRIHGTFPSYEQLKEWWTQEREFMDTSLGRQWYAVRHDIIRMQHENDHYKRLVLDYTELHTRETFNKNIEIAIDIISVVHDTLIIGRDCSALKGDGSYEALTNRYR